jgi:hypothetical protein
MRSLAVSRLRKEDVVIHGPFMLVLIAWLIGGGVHAASDAPSLFHLDPGESRIWFDADARLHSFRGETQQLTGRFILNDALPRSSPMPS